MPNTPADAGPLPAGATAESGPIIPPTLPPVPASSQSPAIEPATAPAVPRTRPRPLSLHSMPLRAKAAAAAATSSAASPWADFHTCSSCHHVLHWTAFGFQKPPGLRLRDTCKACEDRVKYGSPAGSSHPSPGLTGGQSKGEQSQGDRLSARESPSDSPNSLTMAYKGLHAPAIHQTLLAVMPLCSAGCPADASELERLCWDSIMLLMQAVQEQGPENVRFVEQLKYHHVQHLCDSKWDSEWTLTWQDLLRVPRTKAFTAAAASSDRGIVCLRSILHPESAPVSLGSMTVCGPEQRRRRTWSLLAGFMGAAALGSVLGPLGMVAAACSGSALAHLAANQMDKHSATRRNDLIWRLNAELNPYGLQLSSPHTLEDAIALKCVTVRLQPALAAKLQDLFEVNAITVSSIQSLPSPYIDSVLASARMLGVGSAETGFQKLREMCP